MSNGFASFIVGMGNGYLSAKNKAEKEAQDKEDRDLRRQLVGMQVKTAQQALDDQQAIRAAGANVTPVENAPGDGMGPSATMVGKQAFGTAPDQVAQADTAAQAMNTPQAKASRQLVKMQEINPQAAVKMQADQLTLDDAQRKHLNTMFDDSLSSLGTHDDIAKMVSDSPHDGQGGALKLQVKPSADGKTVDYLSVGADGLAKPTGLSFANTPQGLLEAKQYLSKNVSTDTKLKHIYDAQRAATDAADKATDNARQDREVEGKIAYWRAMGSAADTRAEKYGGSGANKLPEIDKIRLSNLYKQADDISQAIIKSKADGSWDETSPDAKSLTTQLTALRMQSNDLAAKYSGGTGAGDILGLSSSTPSNSAAAAHPQRKLAPMGGGAVGDSAPRPLLKMSSSPPIPRASFSSAMPQKTAAALKQVRSSNVAKNDAKVLALQQSIANAASGRSRLVLEGQLRAYLTQNYGIDELN